MASVTTQPSGNANDEIPMEKNAGLVMGGLDSDDPLPFSWMAHHPGLCSNTKFVDVDFEALMMTKREIIFNTPQMRDMLSIPTDEEPQEGIVFDSAEYAGIGCDLRNTRRLERLIKSVVDVEQCLVLCVAEVSITYMSTEDSDALIRWTAGLSPDVTFCLLEQQSPDRPDNPFTATMLKHFAKLGTPLRSVLEYPGCHTQTLRFQDAGYAHVEIQNLWELWADPRFLTPSVRMSLDDVEPFDEWEEFALFGSHYCLLVAQTGSEPLIPEQQRGSRRASIDSLASDLSTRTVSPHRENTQWFAYKYTAESQKESRTHHGSAYKIADQDALGVHGGVGLKGRLSTTSVYTSTESSIPYPSVPPEEIGARCCHTITSFGSRLEQNLLVGGRASPSAPMKDCWLQVDGKWERVHDLPEPRFRHRCAAVVLPHDQYGVVLYGGKTSATKVAIDTLLWDRHNGWQVLHNVKSDPLPRFGASFARIGFNHGLLMGGMRQDGVVCQGLWKWRLIIRDNKVIGIRFKTSNCLDASAGIWPWMDRFGASYSVIRDELLLIGGIAKHGCIPRDYEILSFVGSFSAFNDYEKEMELRVACVLPKIDPNVPRPFLIGHSTHYTAKATTLIVGGGATCFSFGAYWNPGCWLLHDREAGPGSRWAMIKPEETKVPSLSQPPMTNGSLPCMDSISIQHIELSTDQGFVRILREGAPKLLKTLDFGPCLSRWTPSYLVSKTPASKAIVIHAAQSRTMNFQRKDFAYKATSFHAFINHIQTTPSAHMYLRSISNTNPTGTPADFWTDWPEISDDFHIPSSLNFIESHKHSSPLRISANVNMWLHYDVMANVLFQVRGTRKLVLFPPCDLKQLSFPPGSTSSTLDVFQPAEQVDTGEDSIRHVPNTHPHVAILRPGEALYIPPLWAHTGTPLSSKVPRETSTKASTSASASASATSSISESHDRLGKAPNEATANAPGSNIDPDDNPAHSKINISLNVFFRTLSPQKYAAGRDVYGNRDLAAYEDGRRDVEKIVRRFLATSNRKADGEEKSPPASADVTESTELNMDSIPRDMVKAYLERLSTELQERADKL
ncbi:tRNA methyltransferase ppm2 [Cladophialophora chaetospira]|uniref:tRNA methyltransferase ppm2 n=1 Tax=Cladophialophora chaetospira TaxID=386627 RepID=A0AA39CDJ7_9EURO|nr:tRNA methyltransferase ppm2 [Cladophialophora chaetospira]